MVLQGKQANWELAAKLFNKIINVIFFIFHGQIQLGGKLEGNKKMIGGKCGANELVNAMS